MRLPETARIEVARIKNGPKSAAVASEVQEK